jgi:hypothetical protein
MIFGFEHELIDLLFLSLKAVCENFVKLREFAREIGHGNPVWLPKRELQASGAQDSGIGLFIPNNNAQAPNRKRIIRFKRSRASLPALSEVRLGEKT